MASSVRRALPFGIATALALGHVALVVKAALHHTGGQFCYPIDDAFIHLALAKHIAFDGVYGVTAHGFTASSSSIVWPFLLAAVMKVVGNAVTIPFALNVIFAIAMLAVIGRGLQREAPSMSLPMQTVVLAGIVILVPMATLVVLGMEHVLHAALTIALVLEAARVIAGETKSIRFLAILAAATAAARYEAIFPVGLASIALVLRKRWRDGIVLAASGAAPIVLFGLWSRAHGGMFFPNSIELKRQQLSVGSFEDFQDVFGGKVVERAWLNGHLAPILVGTALLFFLELRRARGWSKDAIRLGLAFLTTAAHIELASLGWFYRYEAYLIALDLTVIAIALAGMTESFAFGAFFKKSPALALSGVVLAFVALAPLYRRAMEAQGFTPLACRNIFQQQVQTARFLAKEFPNEPIAINDIGAPAYYGTGQIIDLVGLAQLDVARAKHFKLDEALLGSDMERFGAPAKVAVIYEEWFPHVPPSWVRLGKLRIDANHTCAFDSVAVFATSGEHVPRVLSALRDFAPELPAEVRREGRFVETPPQPPSEWRADTGDAIWVGFDGAEDLSGVLRVDPSGAVPVPKVGLVMVRGLDLAGVIDATRKKMANPHDPIPPGLEPKARLVMERGCRETVAGRVLRSVDELEPCHETADVALARAGTLATSKASAYLWREEAGALKKIAFDYDPADPTSARAIELAPGDVVIAP